MKQLRFRDTLPKTECRGGISASALKEMISKNGNDLKLLCRDWTEQKLLSNMICELPSRSKVKDCLLSSGDVVIYINSNGYDIKCTKFIVI